MTPPPFTPLGTPAGGILVSDFDGTMTDRDFYTLVRDRLLPPGFPDLWSDYRAGRLTHFEALNGFFSAIRADDKAIRRILDDMQLDIRLGATLVRLGKAGWRVVIASAGCAWYIERLLGDRLAGVELHANPGRYSPGSGLVMELPRGSQYFCPEVGIDKPAIVRSAMRTGCAVAFAGDGVPDIEAALLVDPKRRFARGELAASLELGGQPFVGFNSWSEIPSMLLASRVGIAPLEIP